VRNAKGVDEDEEGRGEIELRVRREGGEDKRKTEEGNGKGT